MPRPVRTKRKVRSLEGRVDYEHHRLELSPEEREVLKFVAGRTDLWSSDVREQAEILLKVGTGIPPNKATRLLNRKWGRLGRLEGVEASRRPETDVQRVTDVLFRYRRDQPITTAKEVPASGMLSVIEARPPYKKSLRKRSRLRRKAIKQRQYLEGAVRHKVDRVSIKELAESLQEPYEKVRQAVRRVRLQNEIQFLRYASSLAISGVYLSQNCAALCVSDSRLTKADRDDDAGWSFEAATRGIAPRGLGPFHNEMMWSEQAGAWYKPGVHDAIGLLKVVDKAMRQDSLSRPHGIKSLRAFLSDVDEVWSEYEPHCCIIGGSTVSEGAEFIAELSTANTSCKFVPVHRQGEWYDILEHAMQSLTQLGVEASVPALRDALYGLFPRRGSSWRPFRWIASTSHRR